MYNETLSKKVAASIFELIKRWKDSTPNRHMKNIRLAEGLDDVKKRSPHKNPYNINIMEHYNSKEPTTSWVLGNILNYRKGNDPIIVRSFINRFLCSESHAIPTAFDVSQVQNPQISIEKHRIDILIQERNQYAIIVENKLKDAVFQQNQLGRYIHLVKEKFGYREQDIYIIILPNTFTDSFKSDLPKSIWCCPKDAGIGVVQKNIQCAYRYNLCLCDEEKRTLTKQEKQYCESCTNYRQGICFEHTTIVHKELSLWLKDIVADDTIPHSEFPLRSMILQFADFLDYLYKNRDNNLLKKDMEKYLREQLLSNEVSPIENVNIIKEKIKEVEQLANYLKNLRETLIKETINAWGIELKKEWPDIDIEKDKNFGLLIEEVWCGCWVSDDYERIYWGFLPNKNSAIKQKRKMVADICNHTDAISKGEEGGFLAWDYTQRGVERCSKFYNVAKELGYLK